MLRPYKILQSIIRFILYNFNIQLIICILVGYKNDEFLHNKSCCRFKNNKQNYKFCC